MEKIRAHIEKNLDRPVQLKELGRVAGLSPFTVQRLFKREMGVSPLEYQRALRAGQLRSALKQGRSVTDAIYSAGFGSSSRAYEGSQLGMTPARFAQGGRGERIGFASARTPFGWMIVGATERGLCWLSLADTKSDAEKNLREEFPAATLRRDPSLSRSSMPRSRACALALHSSKTRNPWNGSTCAAQFFSFASGRRFARFLAAKRAATRSWRAKWAIPKPRVRWLAPAPLNRVALLVPCHRVVGANGSLTGYRWGVASANSSY